MSLICNENIFQCNATSIKFSTRIRWKGLNYIFIKIVQSYHNKLSKLCACFVYELTKAQDSITKKWILSVDQEAKSQVNHVY